MSSWARAARLPREALPDPSPPFQSLRLAARDPSRARPAPVVDKAERSSAPIRSFSVLLRQPTRDFQSRQSQISWSRLLFSEESHCSGSITRVSTRHLLLPPIADPTHRSHRSAHTFHLGVWPPPGLPASPMFVRLKPRHKFP